ncbi:MAG: hypothetical protein H0T73_17370 [Ardenticatenales bacterium]|nr:hypothetical protein [Ardenticatenales bacterium]
MMNSQTLKNRLAAVLAVIGITLSLLAGSGQAHAAGADETCESNFCQGNGFQPTEYDWSDD